MKVTKESLIDWMVSNNEGKIVARITKTNGFYAVYQRNVFSGKMEHFINAISFKEAKSYAIA